MSEVNRYVVDCNRLWKGGQLKSEVDVYVVLAADFDRVTAENSALQALLTAADERADVLEGLLRTSLVAMTRIYSAGRDFIVGAGSDCDSVELMMENDPTAREIRAALKPAEGPRNQCDGCQAGIPVENGAHRMGKPGGYPDLMGCTAKLYKPAEGGGDE